MCICVYMCVYIYIYMNIHIAARQGGPPPPLETRSVPAVGIAPAGVAPVA